MAELLGVISGGVGIASLVIQLGDSALKLRHFCGSYRYAPNTLEDTAYEIETFQLLLKAIESDLEHRDVANDLVLDRCVQICEKGVKRINLAVNKLATLMQRSRVWGKLRTAAEEKELKQLCSELYRATTSLVLAYQLHAEQQRRRDVKRDRSLVVQQVALSFGRGSTVPHPPGLGGMPDLASVQAVSTNVGSSHSRESSWSSQITASQLADPHVSPQRKAARKRRPQYTLKMSPYFTALTFNISLQRDLFGYQLSLQTTHEVSRDSPLCVFAERGEVSTLRKIFDRRLASPNIYWDDIHNGGGRYEDLLTASMERGYANACQYLLEILPLNERKFGNGFEVLHWRTQWSQTSGEIYRILLADQELDLEHFSPGHALTSDLRENFGTIGCYAPSARWFANATSASLQILKNSLLVPYTNLPLSTRFENAMSISCNRGLDLELFLQFVGSTEVNTVIAKMESLAGQNALHFVALHLATSASLDSAIVFTQAFLQAGADIHKRDLFGVTPLQQYVRAKVWTESAPSIAAWAKLLHALGVDLVAYGQKETVLWDIHEFVVFNRDDIRLESEGFVFGPDINDWDLLIRETNQLTLWEYLPPPGSWTPTSAKELLSRTICWTPDDFDEPHFHWVPTRTLEPKSTLYLASQQQQKHEIDLSKWELTQDDAGPIVLAMAERRASHSRRRCTSQPPLSRYDSHARTYRVSYDYSRATRKGLAGGLDWLYEYNRHYVHVCDYGSGQKLVCSSSEGINPARCLQGHNDKSLLWDAIDRNIQNFRREYLRQASADAYKLEHGL